MKNNYRIPRVPTPDERARMMKDCLDSLDPSFQKSTDKKDVALEHLDTIRTTVIKQLRPIISAIVIWHPEVVKELMQTVADLYAAELCKLSQEDLILIQVYAETNRMMAKIAEQV